MKIQPIDSNIVSAPIAVQSDTNSPGTFNLSDGHGNSKEPNADSQKDKPKETVRPREPETVLSSRQLIEVPGNPEATAQNAARLRRELSIPTNPYPSVSDLVRAKKALETEMAARAQMKSAERPGTDRRA